MNYCPRDWSTQRARGAGCWATESPASASNKTKVAAFFHMGRSSWDMALNGMSLAQSGKEEGGFRSGPVPNRWETGGADYRVRAVSAPIELAVSRSDSTRQKYQNVLR